MAKVQFFTADIFFQLPHPRKTTNWLRRIASVEKRSIQSITYIFCSDEYLRTLNKQFLNHTTYTDILSFDSSEDDNIQGEIYISIDRVKDNAVKYKQSFERELNRVIAHGLLHFLGYKDKGVRHIAQMRSKEEACLSLWK